MMRRLLGVAVGAVVTYALRTFAQRRVDEFRERFQDLPKENYGNIDDLDIIPGKKDEKRES